MPPVPQRLAGTSLFEPTDTLILAFDYAASKSWPLHPLLDRTDQQIQSHQSPESDSISVLDRSMALLDGVSSTWIRGRI